MSDDKDFLGISYEGWRTIAADWLSGAAFSISISIVLAAVIWMVL